MSVFRSLMMANQGYPADATVIDVELTDTALEFAPGLGGNASVYWGDGEKTQNVSALGTVNKLSHIYASPGIYTVVIRSDGGNYWLRANSPRVIRVRQIGTAAAQYAMFENCTGIKQFDPGVTLIGTAVQAFSFLSITTITELNEDFAVRPNNALTSFNYYGALSKVPDSVAAVMADTTSLYRAFRKRPGVTGLLSAPADMHVSENCTELALVFCEQNNLVFDITNFFPEAWANGGYTVNVMQMFDGCKRITGTAPAHLLWESGNTWTNTTNAFRNCTGLSNYNEIPASWGGGGA